jgi:hypothetical protein
MEQEHGTFKVKLVSHGRSSPKRLKDLTGDCQIFEPALCDSVISG